MPRSSNSDNSLPDPAIMFSHRTISELDEAAIKIQKVYKSYRTRRRLADCAIVVEVMWLKVVTLAYQSSVTIDKQTRENARHGVSPDETDRELTLQIWLEAIDPRHRYGHDLHLYYTIWIQSKAGDPFFYWLDVGYGKVVDLEKWPSNLANCATFTEELRWKILDFALLKQSSVLFFKIEKFESAVSMWSRACIRVAKVGKGLCNDEKAKKLAVKHWLEAIDPRHRYGNNLHDYHEVWSKSKSAQPFFYWLDDGDGKEINLEKCQRKNLQRQCIKYLGPKEREKYKVVVQNGKLVYQETGHFVNTTEESKWIFVLSTTRTLYVGEKKKGQFHHSSFLAGGAITAAGILVAHGGIIEAILPHSGHYKPMEENFREFIGFLEERSVDLGKVMRSAIYDDSPPSKEQSIPKDTTDFKLGQPGETSKFGNDGSTIEREIIIISNHNNKRSTRVGPRISSLREYPPQFILQAFNIVHLTLDSEVSVVDQSVFCVYDFH